MDRIVEDGKNIEFTPICNKCKNHIKGDNCKAFLVIPDLIILGEDNHSKPLGGQDNNIVFEPINEEQSTNFNLLNT